MRFRDLGSEDWSRLITTCVAVSTALFTIASFGYTELIAPNTAPVNIALDMSIDPKARDPVKVSPIGLDPKNRSGRFAAVYIRIKAVNASNKTIRLINPYWLVFGRHKPPQTTAEVSNKFLVPKKLVLEFNKSLGDPYKDGVPRLEIEKDTYDIQPTNGKQISKNDEKLLKKTTRELIAVGELDSKRTLKPRETLDTQRVIFVNADSGYDFLETRVYIPSSISEVSTQFRKILFYASINESQLDNDHYEAKNNLKIQASSTNDRLLIGSLENQWCEQSVSDKLRYSMNPGQMADLLDLSLFQQQTQGNQSKQTFCITHSDNKKGSFTASGLLTPSQRRDAGVQLFTATSEVLLLKSSEDKYEQL